MRTDNFLFIYFNVSLENYRSNFFVVVVLSKLTKNDAEYERLLSVGVIRSNDNVCEDENRLFHSKNSSSDRNECPMFMYLIRLLKPCNPIKLSLSFAFVQTKSTVYNT